jgi:hypothetical protein
MLQSTIVSVIKFVYSIWFLLTTPRKIDGSKGRTFSLILSPLGRGKVENPAIGGGEGELNENVWKLYAENFDLFAYPSFIPISSLFVGV